MDDKLIRATAGDNEISVIFCSMKDTCNEAIRVHNLKGIPAQILSEALIGVVLLSSTLKNSNDYCNIIIKSNGPVEGLTVYANQKGQTKGYLHNPEAKGDSVAEVLGTGILTVSKDLDMREPYVGQLPLISGEIADDISMYFSKSEQIPSSCGIEVEFNEDGTVKEAGGFLIQLMPDASSLILNQLETDLSRHPSPVKLLNDYGNDYKAIVKSLLPALNTEILSENKIEWFCDCSEEKTGRALLSLGKNELEDIIKVGQDTEIVCDFCKSKYKFTPEDVKNMLDKQNFQD